MDRGTEQDAPPGRRTGDGTGGGPTGAARVPPAAVVVDRDGLVSHWSGGARRLFGLAGREALGRPAVDLLPVSGALPEEDGAAPYGTCAGHDGPGPGPSPGRGRARQAAGRARLTVSGTDRLDVLWWAYPLVGQDPERLLVLAVDAGGPHTDGAGAFERVALGFAPHTGFPGSGDLARALPGLLPGLSVAAGARIVARVLELGCPVLEFGRDDRVPVTSGRSAPRRAGRREHGERAARGPAAGGTPPVAAGHGPDGVRVGLPSARHVTGRPA